MTAQASLRPVSGGSYTNVSHDPSSETFTLNFTGGPLPLGILWLWRPHCADPVMPGVFTLTVDGQSSSSGPSRRHRASPGWAAPRHWPLTSSTLRTPMSWWGWPPPPWPWILDGRSQRSGRPGQRRRRRFGARAVPTGRVVGMAADPNGHGYWIVSADGGVFSFRGARFTARSAMSTSMPRWSGWPPPPTAGGYWLVAADGGVFSFGDAAFHGSLGGVHLNAPVVGMAATPDGGRLLAGGRRRRRLLLRRRRLPRLARGGAPQCPGRRDGRHPDGGGYWLVAYDGGVFCFGDALFEGSAGDLRSPHRCTPWLPTPSGHGYWLLGGDGGIFTYGDAGFYGSVPLTG